MNDLEAALAYEQLGWFVLPIDPSEKKPIVKWKNRRHRRPDQSEIKKWWEKFPKARVGIATGKFSNVTVIDLDGQMAIEYFASLFGGLPGTITQETGREDGGLQLFFKYNCSEMKNLSKDDIDVRNTGAICLLPPSLHKSGKHYRWKNISPIEYGLDDLLDMPKEIKEWLLAAEYIMSNGNSNVILCERGIRTFETEIRSTLALQSVPLIKELSHLPIIVDPSHAAGKPSLIPAMSKASIAAGADGIIVEVHPKPDEALCDGQQALTPDIFKDMMDGMKPVAEAVGKTM
jgi:hypothetical protein